MKNKRSKKAPNLVAKHAHTCNKSAVFVDRKKRDRSGYEKHKRNFD